MRFHSPDSLAPEEAGLNPYLYALGNPVRWRDPTGHKVSPLNGDQTPDYSATPVGASKRGGLMLFAIFFVASIALAPWSGPVTFGFGLAWGGVAVQGIGLGLQAAGLALEGKNDEASNALSIAGGVVSLIGIGIFAAGRFKYTRLKSKEVALTDMRKRWYAGAREKMVKDRISGDRGGWDQHLRTSSDRRPHSSSVSSTASSRQSSENTQTPAMQRNDAQPNISRAGTNKTHTPETRSSTQGRPSSVTHDQSGDTISGQRESVLMPPPPLPPRGPLSPKVRFQT
ncbi:RHS repeat-associated core domain-containing protein [Pseudomonas alloputida]|uniref:RHS repeat-associated core domain-containing protein n=1 Tax=Pseudomonas alloputida TaxID=1940621 RepID=UPI003D17AF1A